MTRMTRLGLLNYFVLRWFGVRLSRKVDETGTTVGWVWIRRSPFVW